MRTFSYLLFAVLFSISFNITAQDSNKHEGEKVEAKELADGTLYGIDINPDLKLTSISEIYADTSAYSGKNVVVKGSMSEICRSGGCWTVLSDGTNTIRALTLHKFIMPKDMDITGKVAVVEGIFSIKEITEEQAKHFAEESGKDPSTVTGSQKMYRIVATGIKILK